MQQINKTNVSLQPYGNTVKPLLMTQQSTINFAALESLKGFNFADVESELNLKTFVVEYRYNDCGYFFKKEIAAESEAEAIYDAKSFVESENAQVANRPKAGNFIELAFVREWSGKTVAALEF